MEQMTKVHELRWRGIGRREKPFLIVADVDGYQPRWYSNNLVPTIAAEDCSRRFIECLKKQDPYFDLSRAQPPLVTLSSFGPCELRKKGQNWYRRFTDSGKTLRPMIEYIQTKSIPTSKVKELTKPLKEYYWEVAVYINIPYWASRLSDMCTRRYYDGLTKHTDSALAMHIIRDYNAQIRQYFKMSLFLKLCYVFAQWQAYEEYLPDKFFTRDMMYNSTVENFGLLKRVTSSVVSMMSSLGIPYMPNMNPLLGVIRDAKPTQFLPIDEQIPLNGISINRAIDSFLNIGIEGPEYHKYKPVIDVMIKYSSTKLYVDPGSNMQIDHKPVMETLEQVYATPKVTLIE